jgi:hypothetical protein
MCIRVSSSYLRKNNISYIFGELIVPVSIIINRNWNILLSFSNFISILEYVTNDVPTVNGAREPSLLSYHLTSQPFASLRTEYGLFASTRPHQRSELLASSACRHLQSESWSS